MSVMRPRSKDLKISVIIAAYDRPRLLARLLESIARQTLPPDEVIVVDDHSPAADAMAAALVPFRKRFKSLRTFRNPRNLGVGATRNLAIRASRFPLLAFSDDDDEWAPRRLELQAALFRRHWDDTDLVYSWYHRRVHHRGIADIQKPDHEGNPIREILWSNFIVLCSVMAKKEKFLRIGCFRDSLHGAEDWDTWIRFFRAGFTCRVVRSPLCTYHLHAGSKSRSTTFKTLSCLYLNLPTYLRYRPWAILRVLKLTFWRFRDSLRKDPLPPRSWPTTR